MKMQEERLERVTCKLNSTYRDTRKEKEKERERRAESRVLTTRSVRSGGDLHQLLKCKLSQLVSNVPFFESLIQNSLCRLWVNKIVCCE